MFVGVMNFGQIQKKILPVVIFGSLATKLFESLGVLGIGALFPSGNLPATNGG